MMIDWLTSALPLADSEPGYLVSFFGSVWLWAKVAIGIGLVIFVHELGHFLAAKTFGVKCEKFYVGFDVPIRIGPIKFPSTLGKFTYGETEYGIGIVPLGGYVKMLGQDDDPRKAKEEADRIRTDGEDEDDSEQLDPRSYPAKKVWQRMIIISAGVIMNVITGILFAAIAFGYGVNYTPAIIGSVTPGGPAWEAGIEPGGRVISIGDYTDEEMHFREMRLEILTAGLEDPKQPIDIGIRYDDGVRNYKLLTAPHPEDADIRMIGIGMPVSAELSKTSYASSIGPAADVLKETDAGSKVTGYDGRRIDPDAIVPGTPLFDYLNSNPTQAVSLDLEQSDGTRRTVEIPPMIEKSIGINFKIGPITALIEDGPAKKAGVEVGDVIVAVNENEEIDAFSLPVELTKSRGTLQLTVRRGEGDDAKTIDVELQPSDLPQTIGPTAGLGGEVASNAYGFAYRPQTTIASFDGEMSGEDASEIQPGDILKEVHLVVDEALKKAVASEEHQAILEKLEDYKFDKPDAITNFSSATQILPVGTKVVVFAERPPKNEVVKTTLVVQENGRFRFDRGIGFIGTEEIQTASSIGEAISLGWREGKRRLGDVVRFLGMLVRGKVKRKQVGGPIIIFKIAGQEAERGISPQLLFLTMLSMNLAILNFLPIPALDGGHMVFLIAEAIRGKRVDEELELKLTFGGILALLALMVFVFFNDIVNL